MKDLKNAFLSELRLYFGYFIKWTVFSAIMGIAGGAVAASFVWLIVKATEFRMSHSFMLFLMPLAGLLIIFLHDKCNLIKNRGTNTTIEYVHSRKHIERALAPLVYISTVLSHAVGASVGKEGASLQIGGSMGETLAGLFRMDDNDSRLAVMAGMSALYGGAFGMPVAAAIFPIEMISVGIMHYSALFPCMLSSFIAYYVSSSLGMRFEDFVITDIPEFGILPIISLLILGILCGLLSRAFCRLLHTSDRLFSLIKNHYLRILAASAIFIILTFVVDSDLYMGSSQKFLEDSFAGHTPAAGFILKAVFTAVALGGGFKGGEIVPTFCIGASFGCLLGNLTGFYPSLFAGCGMAALFAGVTNCPISTLIIALELMDIKAMPYFGIAVVIAYCFSGYSGLYSSQRIIYSKTRNEFIYNRMQ